MRCYIVAALFLNTTCRAAGRSGGSSWRLPTHNLPLEEENSNVYGHPAGRSLHEYQSELIPGTLAYYQHVGSPESLPDQGYTLDHLSRIAYRQSNRERASIAQRFLVVENERRQREAAAAIQQSHTAFVQVQSRNNEGFVHPLQRSSVHHRGSSSSRIIRATPLQSDGDQLMIPSMQHLSMQQEGPTDHRRGQGSTMSFPLQHFSGPGVNRSGASSSSGSRSSARETVAATQLRAPRMVGGRHQQRSAETEAQRDAAALNMSPTQPLEPIVTPLDHQLDHALEEKGIFIGMPEEELAAAVIEIVLDMGQAAPVAELMASRVQRLMQSRPSTYKENRSYYQEYLDRFGRYYSRVQRLTLQLDAYGIVDEEQRLDFLKLHFRDN